MNRSFVRGLMTISFAVHCMNFIHTNTMACEQGPCSPFLALCDIALGVGSFLGLLVLNSLPNLIGDEDSLIVTYVDLKDMQSRWSDESKRPCAILVCIWICSMVLRGIGAWYEGSWESGLGLVAYGISSGVFMGMAYCIIHISAALISGVDCYCDDLVLCNYTATAHNWNVLQALLRKASSALDNAFVVLQTTALALLVLGLGGVLLAHETANAWHLFSLAMLPFMAALVFFKASDVTEKCARMPSLINSFASGNDEFMDMRVHYLVEYISYSAAGFYVRGVRISKVTAVKIAYVTVVVAFSVVTKILTQESSTNELYLFRR